jgi:DNA-binding HxlR family transcriptional regulator
VNKRDPNPKAAAAGVERALGMLEGRWKLMILYNLYSGKDMRLPELSRVIAGISQRALMQQLRQLERDGLVERVEPELFRISAWGHSLRPILNAMLAWLEGEP